MYSNFDVYSNIKRVSYFVLKFPLVLIRFVRVWGLSLAENLSRLTSAIVESLTPRSVGSLSNMHKIAMPSTKSALLPTVWNVSVVIGTVCPSLESNMW